MRIQDRSAWLLVACVAWSAPAMAQETAGNPTTTGSAEAVAEPEPTAAPAAETPAEESATATTETQVTNAPVPAPTPTPAPQAAPQSVAAPSAAPVAEDTRYMKGASIGLKLGYLSFAESDIIDAQPDETGIMLGRDGMQLMLSLSFGSTFGFSLEPYVAFGSVNSVGLHFGPHFNIKIGRVYVGSGFGFRVGYISVDRVYGGEFFGRIPIRATFYPLQQLGIVTEFGIGYGATIVDYGAGAAEGALGMQYDFSVGVRWR